MNITRRNFFALLGFVPASVQAALQPPKQELQIENSRWQEDLDEVLSIGTDQDGIPLDTRPDCSLFVTNNKIIRGPARIFDVICSGCDKPPASTYSRIVLKCSGVKEALLDFSIHPLVPFRWCATPNDEIEIVKGQTLEVTADQVVNIVFRRPDPDGVYRTPKPITSKDYPPDYDDDDDGYGELLVY